MANSADPDQTAFNELLFYPDLHCEQRNCNLAQFFFAHKTNLPTPAKMVCTQSTEAQETNFKRMALKLHYIFATLSVK